jgi:ubiquitin C-terminal hydrolase
MIFGLSNTNNTCYINSVLQLLLNIKPLRKFFINEQPEDPLLSSYTKIVNFYENNKDSKQIVKPNTFLKNMFEKLYFSSGQQEDSHEFLYAFLDYIHESTKYAVLVQLEQGKDSLVDCKDAWEKFCKDNYSTITKLFYGQIKSSIKCLCGNTSVSRNPFCGITISSDVDTIENGIKEYIHNDVVETNCEKCEKGSLKGVSKIMEIVPEYLIVQVSRFTSNMTKSTKVIEYMDDIDLTSEVDLEINSSGLKYKLIGNVYHAGQVSYGHYMCSVRVDDKWSVINDDVIVNYNKIPEDFLKRHVYILLYKKIKC